MNIFRYVAVSFNFVVFAKTNMVYSLVVRFITKLAAIGVITLTHSAKLLRPFGQ